ncbi:hypothetical protein AJ80_10002 [Polytolypa hystricis UAMH7299]|uniref:BTB domain-containing protein n=1 Tax=Polytolypa hystricis (strain UAMH7299) TaxID=1447883 RepID=A0A2B7WF70_POLH7|nr:hypothetical protein AJ80_10002 [Polytolypa hystricis UAMH7299]
MPETVSFDTGCIPEDARPKQSPYIKPPVTLRVGCEDYTIPRHYLERSPKLVSKLGFTRTISLSHYNADTVHTLVHYLYEGEYQTLKQPDLTMEYRRSVLVYCAARSLELNGLATLARGRIEGFDKDLPIFDILDMVKEVYPQLLQDETWLHDYLATKIMTAFARDGSLFTQEYFLHRIREPFTRALVKIIMKISNGMASGTVNKKDTEQQALKHVASEDFHKEATGEEQQLSTPDIVPEASSDAAKPKKKKNKTKKVDHVWAEPDPDGPSDAVKPKKTKKKNKNKNKTKKEDPVRAEPDPDAPPAEDTACVDSVPEPPPAEDPAWAQPDPDAPPAEDPAWAEPDPDAPPAEDTACVDSVPKPPPAEDPAWAEPVPELLLNLI